MKKEFISPVKKGYTIYTKEKCIYCEKVKELLEKEEMKIIPCDNYLLENKEKFLDFIEKKAGISYKTFPMVFLDEIFIGGFTETKKMFDNNNIFKQDYEF